MKRMFNRKCACQKTVKLIHVYIKAGECVGMNC